MSNLPEKGTPAIIGSSAQTTQQGLCSQQQNLQSSMELNHQTFQAWIDTLVDPNSSEEIKLKAVQDLSLNLEVDKLFFLILHD